MRRPTLFISGVLLLVLLTTPEAGAASLGGVCKKAGSTTTSAGKKLVCVKQGKKLVWAKANSSVAAQVPTAPSTPVSGYSKWEKTYLKIWDAYIAAQSQGSFPFDYKLSPTVNKAKAEESIEAYNQAMKPWLVIMGDQKPYPILWTIMSEKDYSWWRELVEQQEGALRNLAWDSATDRLGHCQLSARAFCGYGNSFKSNTFEYTFLQYNVIGSDYTGSPNANAVHHEATHFYQLSMIQSFPRDTPCWYVEGQASLYGNALQSNPSRFRAEAKGQRDNFKLIVRQYQGSADRFGGSDWVSVLEKMYWPDVSCSSEQDYFKYALGAFAWEYLYDEYGPGVMHQLLLEFRTKSFDAAVKDRLGVTISGLNRAIAEHLVSVFAQGN